MTASLAHPPRSSDRRPLPSVGSALYYALRLVPAARRPALRDWWQWWHEVSSIPYDVQDPGVAETKLRWWQQEVRAAVQGQATHPLTQSLLGQGPGHPPKITPPPEALWQSQLDGLIDLIHQTRWLDAAALTRHQDQTTAAAAEGCAVLLGAASAPAREAARQLGRGWRQAHQLARLGQDAKAGWVHVPVDTLQQHQVRAHELTKPAPQAGPHWPGLLTYLCDQAQAQMEAGLNGIRALPRAERRALRPLVALTHMQLALLAEIRGSQDLVLHQRLLLTPLRKWWISTQVRLGRSRPSGGRR